MNLFQYQCHCTVCGEAGYANMKDAGLDWLGVAFTHNDPAVCAENIAWKKRQKKAAYEKAQVMNDGAGI